MRVLRRGSSGAWQPLVSLVLGLAATTIVSHALGWLGTWKSGARHDAPAAAVSGSLVHSAPAPHAHAGSGPRQ